MIQPIKRPPEPEGSAQQQLEDIRTYLNILYRKVMTDGDEAVKLARELYQSLTEGNNPELANLFVNTITANRVITDSISAKVIETGDFVSKSNLTDGITQISGNNIRTGQISANYLNINGISAQNVDISGTLKALQGMIGRLQVVNNGLAFQGSQPGGSFQLRIDNPDTIPEVFFSVGNSQTGAYVELTSNNGMSEGKLNDMQVRTQSRSFDYATLEDILDEIERRLDSIDNRLTQGGL